ncbi:hypothetical protein GCM10010344_52040 [Streptomyces bluensis]|nr:hypothetical protein GCM10010344_52040 [Streptomyces bluensis]
MGEKEEDGEDGEEGEEVKGDPSQGGPGRRECARHRSRCQPVTTEVDLMDSWMRMRATPIAMTAIGQHLPFLARFDGGGHRPPPEVPSP